MYITFPTAQVAAYIDTNKFRETSILNTQRCNTADRCNNSKIDMINELASCMYLIRFSRLSTRSI